MTKPKSSRGESQADATPSLARAIAFVERQASHSSATPVGIGVSVADLLEMMAIIEECDRTLRGQGQIVVDRTSILGHRIMRIAKEMRKARRKA